MVSLPVPLLETDCFDVRLVGPYELTRVLTPRPSPLTYGKTSFLIKAGTNLHTGEPVVAHIYPKADLTRLSKTDSEVSSEARAFEQIDGFLELVHSELFDAVFLHGGPEDAGPSVTRSPAKPMIGTHRSPFSSSSSLSSTESFSPIQGSSSGSPPVTLTESIPVPPRDYTAICPDVQTISARFQYRRRSNRVLPSSIG